jgi:hypothetical protein
VKAPTKKVAGVASDSAEFTIDDAELIGDEEFDVVLVVGDDNIIEVEDTSVPAVDEVIELTDEEAEDV